MILLGLVSIVVALLCLTAERHLKTRGLLVSGAVLALLTGAVLLWIGATDGVLGVLAVSIGACVASVGGVFLIVRSIRQPRGPR
jgi:hypothetical protein